MKKIVSLLLLTAMSCLLLAGCGDSATYKDGTYTAQSEVYESLDEDEEIDEAANGYGVVTITITDGKISDCTFSTFELDGTPKDADYGKQNGEVMNSDYYNKAQKAVAACDEYAAQLVQAGNIKDIDAISGATINYNEFQDAAAEALKQAKE